MKRIRHIGIIPDGARRWAAANRRSLKESYSLSMRNLAELLCALFDGQVEAVSVYLLSRRNLQRTAAELGSVAEAEAEFVMSAVPDLARRYDVSVVVAGLWSLAPTTLREAIEKLPPRAQRSSRLLNLLIAYDPTDELLQCFNSAGRADSADLLWSQLWVREPIDLVIRTGGVEGGATLSDFLPLQCGYARLVFLEGLFNDIGVEEFVALVAKYDAARFPRGR